MNTLIGWMRKRRNDGAAGVGLVAGNIGTQIKLASRVLYHPFDVFGQLRYRMQGAVAVSVILLVLAVVVLLVSEAGTSYLFGGLEWNQIRPTGFLLRYLIPWATWVAANYMIGSIMKGQGKILEIFVGSTYALMPVIVFTMPLTLISNVLSLSEGAVYRFFDLAVTAWTLYLIFVMVMEVHNYQVGETVVNIVVTILFMLAIWILTFIFIGLTYQLYDFLAQIYKEVAVR